MTQNVIRLRNRLTTRFIAIALLLFLAPQAFLYFFSSNTASNMLIESLRDNLKEKAFLVGADIDRLYSQRERDVRILSQADVLEGDDINAIVKYLTEIIEETPYLDDIDVIDEGGIVIASSGEQNERGQRLLDMHPSLTTLFADAWNAQQGDVFVSEIMELDSGPGSAFLVPVTDDTNTDVVKVLLVEINLSTVTRIVADFDDRVIGDKFVYLVDNNGRVIVTADPEASLLSPFPDIIVQPELLNNFSLQGDVGSVIYVDAKGEEVMAGFADMSEFGVNKAMDWSIIAVAPIADITAPVENFRNALLVFSASLFTAVVLAMYLMSRKILRSVQRLVNAARRVGQGDIHFRVDNITDDEFGYLARTFNQTLDSLVSTQRGALRAQRMEAVGQLTGGIAHDFNNLMVIMAGNAELLGDRIGKDEKSRAYINEIISAVDRGASLTHRLLAFSRKTPLAPVAVDVAKLVADITDLLERTLGETIQLRVEGTLDLCFAMIDPHQLENALINLAINARDAMPWGGSLKIQTSNITLDENFVTEHEELKQGKYVKVVVSDTGIGMARDVVVKAFEPFYTTKEPGRGSGLGLSMVYGFAKQSEGHVTIESQVDRGTTVNLYIPQSSREAARPAPRVEGLINPRGSERILVVEDDPVVRQIPATYLGDHGYEIVEAGNGEEAVDYLKNGRPFDLLFTDVVLPGGMNGVEIGEKAKRNQPRIKIIYTTGYADSDVIDELTNTNAIVLRKPYSRDELLEIVRTSLDSENVNIIRGLGEG